jgi:hypothetical protein
MGRCGECRWWDRAGQRSRGWCRCSVVNEKVFDGADRAGWVQFREDFGCICFEKREVEK